MLFKNKLSLKDAGVGLSKEQKIRAWIRTLAVGIVGAVVVSLASVLVTIAVRQDQGQDRSKETLSNTQQTKQILTILQCYTIPTKPCYKKNAEGQKAILLEFEKVELAAVLCARNPKYDTIDEMLRCVDEQLK